MKKVVLLLLKFVPVIGALCCAGNSLLSHFGYDLVWLGYVMQFTFLIAWYALAIYFKFCTFYKLLVLYVMVCEAINTIDYVFELPITEWGSFVMHCGIIGLFIIIFTIIHVRDTKKVKQHLEEMR